MGLRSLFRRRPTAAGAAVSTVALLDKPKAEESLTPEQLAELQEAWAELKKATEGSGLAHLHACSRNGKRWEENPAAVRGLGNRS
jgi:hypothetical protein